MGRTKPLTVVQIALAVSVACLPLFFASSARSAPGPGIVFERGGDLYAVALDGSRTIRLTATPARERAPAVSSDGRVIAFVRETRASVFGDIWTIHADGTHRVRLTHGGEDWSPSWSPEGRIYFSRYVQGADGACGSIFRIDSNGRNLRRVLGAPRFHSFDLPAVSPDGRRIAFDDWDGCSGGTSSPRLRVIDSAGRPTTDLARLPHNGYYPNPEHDSASWAPDGSRIAFLLNGRLTVASRDGSAVRTVTGSVQIADSWTHPAWSPDGHWLALITRSADLYIVHPDGSALRRITRTGWWGDSPAWLPNLPG